MKKIFNFLLIFVIPCSTQAQIITDGSLNGISQELQGPNYQITEEFGKREGNNLFHSFETFGIDPGEEATFSGEPSIEQVISRVTGGDSTTISGILSSTIPQADFYFINPNGIIFKGNAEINVPGSVAFSTKNSLEFSDGTLFSATDNFPNPILTSAAPKDFGFLSEFKNDSSIRFIKGNNQESKTRLETKADETIFISNYMEMTDSKLTANGLDRDKPSHLRIITDNLTLTDSTIDSNSGGKGAYINIKANELITLTGLVSEPDTINTSISAGNEDGKITIDTKQFFMEKKALIKAYTSNEANAGNIIIFADHIHMKEDATIDTSTYPNKKVGKIGNGGKIKIHAKTLEMSDDTWIISDTFNNGNGGTIHLHLENLYLRDNSVISTTVFNKGEGGQIHAHIKNDIDIKDNASIIVGTSASGDGGTIVLVVSNNELKQYVLSNDQFFDSMDHIKYRKEQITEAVSQGATVDANMFVGEGKTGTIYVVTKDELLSLLEDENLVQEGIQFSNCKTNEQQIFSDSGKDTSFLSNVLNSR